MGNGIEVVNHSGSYGMHLIRRANRRAAAETWNVPQVRVRLICRRTVEDRAHAAWQVPDLEPSSIAIKVTTASESDRWDALGKKGSFAV